MNNGSRDTSTYDIQKLQQQLQDIKEQVRIITPEINSFFVSAQHRTNERLQKRPFRGIEAKINFNLEPLTINVLITAKG